MLMQHTAGSHGVQWRHLFEDERITDHFRLIAYDLPFHGKSVPPTGKAWWTERVPPHPRQRHGPGRRAGERARARSPGVHGLLGRRACSPSIWRATTRMSFRAVIALEPALKVDVDIDTLQGFWHPQVSNEYKSRLDERC